MFGQGAFLGLDQMNLPKDSLQRIKTAKQLYLLLGNYLIVAYYTNTTYCSFYLIGNTYSRNNT